METAADELVIGDRVRTLDPHAMGEATIPVAALPRHICILGTTGSGKSNTAAVICLELGRLKMPTLVLDRTGEYKDLLSSLEPHVLTPGKDLTMSLFDPRGDYTPRHAEEWISLLDDFSHVNYRVGLSPLQARVLREAFDGYFHGTRRPLPVSELLARLRRAEDESSELRGWAESMEALISKLWPMTYGAMGKTVNSAPHSLEVGELFEPRVTVVDLSQLPDDRAKNMLSQIILKDVYDETRRRGKSDAVRLAVVLDEAQHLAPSEEGYASMPERFAMELRKYGFSLILCASRPSLVSENVIANCNTLISHMLNNKADIEATAGFFVGSGVGDQLRKLPVGVAMMQGNHPEPKDSVRVRVRRAWVGRSMN
jgi:DNA helicase HerA-like ATPase